MKNAGLWLVAVTVLLGLQVICVAEGVATHRRPPLPCEHQSVLELETVAEPSAICYHSQRKTLFVVTDSGVVCEFTPDGEIVKQRLVRDADFEGITHDPSTGLLYVAIEGADTILEVDPETLEPRREFAVPRTFEGKTLMKKGRRGIEGIAFVPDWKHLHGGTFFVANQSLDLHRRPEDISAVFEVEVPLKAAVTDPQDVKILRYFRPPAIDLSGLYYDAQADLLYVICDTENRIMAYTRAGVRLESWVLPGDAQEGIAVDPDGTMFIAQDTGGILKLKIDWGRMPKRP